MSDQNKPQPNDARVAKEIDIFLAKALIVSGNPTVIFDVGANDGLEAELFARRFPKAKICTFEARPDACDLIRERLGQFDNVWLQKGACHETDGLSLPFFPVVWSNNPVGNNPGSSSLFKIADIPESQEKFKQTEIQVSTFRLDTWAALTGISHVDLLWMDIEGAELLALRGMGILLDTVKAIWLETTSIERWEDHEGLEQSEVDKYLSEHGLFPVKSTSMKVNNFIHNTLYLRK